MCNVVIIVSESVIVDAQICEPMLRRSYALPRTRWCCRRKCWTASSINGKTSMTTCSQKFENFRSCQITAWPLWLTQVCLWPHWPALRASGVVWSWVGFIHYNWKRDNENAVKVGCLKTACSGSTIKKDSYDHGLSANCGLFVSSTD